MLALPTWINSSATYTSEKRTNLIFCRSTLARPTWINSSATYTSIK